MTPSDGLNDVRAAIKRAIGAERLRDLHRPSRLADALGVLVYWGAPVGLFIALARLPFGQLWGLAFVAQGFAFQCLGLLSHDAFNHRRIWGDRLSWIGAMVSSFPVLLCPTWYRISHRDHHAYLGTARDTETYKQNLDTVLKRAAFLTLPGDRLAKLGRLSAADAPMPEILPGTPTERRRLRIERVCLVLFLVGVAACAVRWPGPVLCGYVLPLAIVTPLASSLRIILEHADVDPDNRFHLGTYYRTGRVTRFLFVADSGDCHLVHHIFSQIPWYRMGEATRLMRPVLIGNGVVERASLRQLLVGWFIRGFPHRSLWFAASPSPAPQPASDA
ncbi:MAG TPA: fatty acid desaturase [Acetobacteraceae bacterium]|nr:fatty acid desaturase [Acetobacteraceae bacterium]